MTVQDTSAERPTAWRVKKLADDWQLNPKSIYTLIADGKLKSVRAGRHHLIPDSEVRRYLGEQGDVA